MRSRLTDSIGMTITRGAQRTCIIGARSVITLICNSYYYTYNIRVGSSHCHAHHTSHLRRHRHVFDALFVCVVSVVIVLAIMSCSIVIVVFVLLHVLVILVVRLYVLVLLTVLL